MYYNEEQLKELKKKVDEKGQWFKDASFRDTELNLTIDELIDKAYEYVQLSFEYRNIQPDAKQEDIIRVSRLREKLHIDFFLETQRILSNSKKRTNAFAELQGEFTKYNYHFIYGGFGSFYHVSNEKKASTLFIINTFSTLSDWHSPFFQHFVVEEDEKEGKLAQHRIRANEANYELLLAIYLQKWLRWQLSLVAPISQDDTKTTQNNKNNFKVDTDIKPPKTTILIPTGLDELFLDPNDIRIMVNLLIEMGYLDANEQLMPKKGILKILSIIFFVMRQRGYIKSEYYECDLQYIAICFKNKFNLKGFHKRTLELNHPQFINKTVLFKDIMREIKPK